MIDDGRYPKAGKRKQGASAAVSFMPASPIVIAGSLATPHTSTGLVLDQHEEPQPLLSSRR